MGLDGNAGGRHVPPAQEVLCSDAEEVGGVRGEFGQVVKLVFDVVRHAAPLRRACVVEMEEVVVVKWGGELCLFGGVVVRGSVVEEGG